MGGFLEHIDLCEFSEFAKSLKAFQIELASKISEESKSSYHICLSKCKVIKQEFETFSKRYSERSEICIRWDGILTLTDLLKGLVSAEREENWEGHLQVIQRLFPVFLISGSINYLRNGFWYLEKMRKLPHEYPEVYKYFKGAKFVMKTNAEYYKTDAADMKLEQSI